MDLRWIPNALTLSRCALAVLAAGAVLAGAAFSDRVRLAMGDWAEAGHPAPGMPGYPALLAATDAADLIVWPAIAFAAFVIAALTDLLDGQLARRLSAQSAFGAWLDPIADKLLIGLSLAALAITSGSFLLIVPTAVILCRDVFITWLRARLGGGYALPVMAAAKWKTAVEMVAVGLLLALPVISALAHGAMSHAGMPPARLIQISAGGWLLGLALAWLAAALSAWTGLVYLRAASGPAVRPQDQFD